MICKLWSNHRYLPCYNKRCNILETIIIAKTSFLKVISNMRLNHFKNPVLARILRASGGHASLLLT